MKKYLLVIGLITAMFMAVSYHSINDQNDISISTPLDYQFPDYCEYYPPPAGMKNTFRLSQDYPKSIKGYSEEQPWMAYDFKEDYAGYMQSVLDYSMEGNLEVDFVVQKNKVRNWYHAPWMHTDKESKISNDGREYHHGLTKEIDGQPGNLHELQTGVAQTWAVAFYNEPAGYTTGRVWEDPFNPNLMNSDFPDGSVCFKLLFTDAPVEQVPFLEGGLQWTANIYPALPVRGPNETYSEYQNQLKKVESKRMDRTVHILQLDIAVKDPRAEAGWTMGTFIYDGSNKGATWVDRMVPVGMMWGDDEAVIPPVDPTDSLCVERPAINDALQQTVINPYLLRKPTVKTPRKAYVTHHGYDGRMNGPVDNKISSCISCHARAGADDDGNTPAMADFGSAQYTPVQVHEYFKDIPCGIEPIVQVRDGKKNTYMASDFSYQIANGYRNFKQHIHETNAKAGINRGTTAVPEINRGGAH